MIITYTGHDEVLVCTPESEPELIQAWFEEGGRNTDDYERDVSSLGIVEIAVRLTAFPQ